MAENGGAMGKTGGKGDSQAGFWRQEGGSKRAVSVLVAGWGPLVEIETRGLGPRGQGRAEERGKRGCKGPCSSVRRSDRWRGLGCGCTQLSGDGNGRKMIATSEFRVSKDES